MTLHLTPVQLLAILGVLLALILVWRLASRVGHRAAQAARAGTRLMSLTGRVVLTAAGIVGVQWIVFAYPGHIGLRLVVLGLPALVAAYTLTRALTVTGEDLPRRRGRRR